MASLNSRWAAPTFGRHKPALLALTAIALGCTIYYIREQLRSSPSSPKGGLHRSNARRQRSHQSQRRRSRPRVYQRPTRQRIRYLDDEPWGSVPISLDFLTDTAAAGEEYGNHVFLSSAGSRLGTPLTRHLPTIEQILTGISNREEATLLRKELEESYLLFHFWRHLSPSPISEEQRSVIVSELERDGFSAINIRRVLEQHQNRELNIELEQWQQTQDRRLAVPIAQRPSRTRHTAVSEILASGVADAETITPSESERSWGGDGETEQDPETGKEGQSLLNLLYRIAEEQARKDGYIHRRVTCNSCSITPIRGIRYSCANCLDYDLCEQCEAMQLHPKTHVFYKIRIPAPYLGNSRQPEPVWYPGKPSTIAHNLPRDAITKICKDTGYQVPEVEALWEQFRCLAAADWPDDPGQYNLAIDRRTFDKCFVPNTSIRSPPPNLIYDRIFAFYDQNSDGLIGFEEFIKAIASLTRKNLGERSKRIFKGYDIDNDGFVDRRDFLRMFRAYYAATKELTRDIVARMEDEEVSETGAREVVLGSRPISSAFTGGTSPDNQVPVAGKFVDNYGDYRVIDDKGIVNELDSFIAEPEETIGDAAEAAVFGEVRPRHMINKTDASFLYTLPWPVEGIVLADIVKVLDVAKAPVDVASLEDQIAIRRAAHARIAKDHCKRQFIRRRAILNRRMRQSFYLDADSGKVQADVPNAVYGERGPISGPDVMLHKKFRRAITPDTYESFRTSLADKIAELHWPTDSPYEIANQVLEMLNLGWPCWAIQADFSLYGSEPNESAKLVTIVSEQIEEAIQKLDPEVVQEDSVQVNQSLPSPRRSRSSSKVRFQDDLGTDEEHESRSVTSMSSRSIPVNERWGGFEIPEPEKDVGREIVYQVTQEAFNELLDPVFRLREDLALAVQRTASLREISRPLILAAVKDPWYIKRMFDMYQRRWRRMAHGAINKQIADDVDEAEEYYNFLWLDSYASNDAATAEECPRCADKGEKRWVKLGEYCPGSCGYPSKGRRDETTPKVPCPHCVENGKQEYNRDTFGSIYCGACDMPFTAIMEERAKLWSIISRGAPHPDTQESQHNADKEEPLRQAVGISAVEVAGGLRSSLATIHAADSASHDQSTTQKSLETLLEEAGYEAVPDGESSPPPDPTLPQNRPTVVPLPDPTLPQNRPTNAPEADMHTLTEQPANSKANGSKNKTAFKPHTDDNIRLIWYAVLDMVEHEDLERGGPGRLSFDEFEEVMRGEKGMSLGFLDSWIEMASF